MLPVEAFNLIDGRASIFGEGEDIYVSVRFYDAHADRSVQQGIELVLFARVLINFQIGTI
jgi:hypothetical protein